MTPTDDDSLLALEALGDLHSLNNELTKAIEILEKVWQIRQDLGSHGNSDSRLSVMHNLVSAYTDNNQALLAIPLLQEVVKICQKNLPATHPDLLISQHELGWAYLENTEFGKAIDQFETVVEVRRECLPDTHHDRLASKHELGRAYLENKEFRKAIEQFEKVVEIRRGCLPATHYDRLESEYMLAYIYHEVEETEKALPLIRHVHEIESQILDPEDPSFVNTKDLLRNCERQLALQQAQAKQTSRQTERRTRTGMRKMNR